MLHYGPYLLFVSGPMASLFGDFNSSHGSESRNGLGTVSIQTLDQNGDNLDAWKIETLTLIQGVGAPHLLQQEGNRRYTGTRSAGNPVVKTEKTDKADGVPVPALTPSSGDDDDDGDSKGAGKASAPSSGGGAAKEEVKGDKEGVKGDSQDVTEIMTDTDLQLRAMFNQAVVTFCTPNGWTQESTADARKRAYVFAVIRKSLMTHHEYVAANVTTGDVYALLAGGLNVSTRSPMSKATKTFRQVINFACRPNESPASFANRFTKLRAENATVASTRNPELRPLPERLLVEFLLEAIEANTTTPGWSVAATNMRAAIARGEDLPSLLQIFHRHAQDPPKLTGNLSQKKPARRCWSHSEGRCFYPEDCKFTHEGPVRKGHCGNCKEKGHSWTDCPKFTKRSGSKRSGNAGPGTGSDQQGGSPSLDPATIQAIQTLSQSLKSFSPDDKPDPETLQAMQAVADGLAPWGVEGTTLADVAARVGPK